MVETKLGAAYGQRAADGLPARGDTPLEVRIGEEALDRDRTEALGRMQDEDRDMAREERGGRRSLGRRRGRALDGEARADRDEGDEPHPPSMRRQAASDEARGRGGSGQATKRRPVRT
jgi:hypothetical protein